MTRKQLLHYDIIERLGEGGMGVVYKARDTKLSRLVVLKVLRTDELADPVRERRLFREARTASALNHPNIITIHDLVSAEGVSFIVMEYVPGHPLDFLIPSGGLEPSLAVQYADQIVDALEAAHSAGVIHRDLKPANVMITPAGRVKLLDFGLAKMTAGMAAASQSNVPITITSDGSVIGTLSYMSPEQAEAGIVDARSDIFSFGAVLYEMLTGRRAFDQTLRFGSIETTLDEPPSPASIVPSVPEHLSAIVMRCLLKNPADRFQTARDLKSALVRPAFSETNQPPRSAKMAAEGDAALEKLSASSLQKARECYERAIQANPQPAVYAGISEYYATVALLGMGEPSDAAPKSVWAASKALEMDSKVPRALVNLGILRANFDLRWKEARALLDWADSDHLRLRRALFYFRPMGLFDAAKSDAQTDPAALAWIALEEGDLTSADRHASAADLDSWIACWVRAWTLLARNRSREAIEVCQSARELEPQNPMIESALATAYVMHKQTDTARRIVERPGWRPASFAVPYHVVTGQMERAFDAGRAAVQRRDPGLPTILRLPLFRPYRTDSRYRELATALGI